jgi:carbamate kinase
VSTLVVAFGGNAITRSGQRGEYEEQLANVQAMSAALAQLVADGHRLLVTHGNGPQIGQIALQQDIARDTVPPMPFDVAGAMSEGQIGYLLQQSLHNTLCSRNLNRTCVTVITQVVVAADDPAFQNPTKPIGRFYSREEAEELHTQKGWIMVEDAGRGYRRVVPSPRPLHIVEWPAIQALIEQDILVIAAGGGGVPVVQDTSDQLHGVEAVIDKDRAAERLATSIRADVLVLLTDVTRVAVGYGTPHERWLNRVTLAEMKGYFHAGEFPPGSMGPKVEAALHFLENGGERAIITSTEHLVAAIAGEGGTEIVPAEKPLPVRSRVVERRGGRG